VGVDVGDGVAWRHHEDRAGDSIGVLVAATAGVAAGDQLEEQVRSVIALTEIPTCMGVTGRSVGLEPITCRSRPEE
jgi:hypothetical protein